MQVQNLPFIQNIEKRIQSASQLLNASLGHCFVDGLEHRDVNAIYNCLRAYAAVDNNGNAEEIFRTTIVAPFIQNVIPHGSSGGVVAASGDELENDYQQIKKHVKNDFKFLLEIASAENSGLHVFDFLANSILKEVLEAIQKGKPGAFSPGRPKEFLKNYKASLDFLAYLEGYCPTSAAVARFRAAPSYVEFMKQWNVGVYFSLRFQEIAGALDSALTAPSLVLVHNSDSGEEYSLNLTLKQSVTLLDSLRYCWNEEVLVLSCSDKFLRLSLQLLSRYSNWLSSGLAARKKGSAGSNPGCEWALSAAPDDFVYFYSSDWSNGDVNSMQKSNALSSQHVENGTTNLRETQSMLLERIACEMNRLNFYIAHAQVIHDINCLGKEISGAYLDHVLRVLSSCSTEVLDLVKQSILHCGKSLDDLLPLVINTIKEALVQKSVEDLRQLKGITATYRMTNKPLPVRHSPYVAGVLRPLKTFLDGEQATKYLTNDARNSLLLGAATDITIRYYELAADLVSVARKTESSLQRIRQGAQRRAGASSDVLDHNVSDTDKICMQLFLDIQEYGRNLAVLGVEAADIDAYRSLWQCVAPADRKDEIKF
ncbi:hypothetical protein GOBAR_DD23690 [Gossypium barbadense]|nr:hypothetical protein GOBAR_DD23690 [Gossypium barbadense]